MKISQYTLCRYISDASLKGIGGKKREDIPLEPGITMCHVYGGTYCNLSAWEVEAGGAGGAEV